MVMLTEVWREVSVRMIINDFKSLPQDKTHNKWLTEEAVIIIMRIDTALINTFMINLNVWTVYVNSEQWEEN